MVNKVDNSEVRNVQPVELEKGAAFEKARVQAVVLQDVMQPQPASKETKRKTALTAPTLQAPKASSSSQDVDGMEAFLTACTASFNATKDAVEGQTNSITGLNTLNNDTSFTVLQTSDIEMAEEVTAMSLESKLSGMVSELQAREGGVDKYLSWIGFGVIALLTVSSMVASDGATSLEAVDLVEEASNGSIDDLEAGGDGDGDAVELNGRSLKSEENQVEENMQANRNRANQTVRRAYRNGRNVKQVKPDTNASSRFWKDLKNGARCAQNNLRGTGRLNDLEVTDTTAGDFKNGARCARSFLTSNDNARLLKGLKFVMQLSGTATSVTPQMIEGADRVAIGDSQRELAGVQRTLATYKANLQEEMTITQSFGVLNKKEADMEKDLYTQVASEISLSGDFFTEISKMEIGA